ncbi:MAG: PilZ domain-containing protein [Deltaproteobacteria bacterium]|nr:PilZ domain-containing protein [Deltaproteobacteria bacterium]
MTAHDALDFDIDVDLSPVYDRLAEPLLIDARWYDLVMPRAGRAPELQAKLDQMFENVMLRAQWRATQRRALDRRRAVRVPLLSRLLVTGGKHLVACDISMSGLRASGEPNAPLMDVEFKLPGLSFPVEARVEVVSYKPANVIPLVGLRFAWIDKPYVEHIARYIGRRRSQSVRTA